MECMQLHKKIYGVIKHNTQLFACNLFDEITIKKVEKKKIQIILQGEFSKGIPNNEENTIFKTVDTFFQTHHKSFGVEITVTKNIPQGTGLQEEEQMIEFVLQFLHAQYSETFTSQFENIVQNKNFEIITFPEYKIRPDWITSISDFLSLPENTEKKQNLLNYSPLFSLHQNIIFSYYPDIYKKYLEYKELPHCQNVELIENGSALYIFS